MKTILTSGFLALIAAGVFPASTRADQWTGPEEVARAARDFAEEAGRLQAALRFHDAVAKGAAYADALREYRKIERDYAHFEGGLKEAHDVHHDEQVVAEVKKTKAAFDRLKARMS